LFTNKGLEVFFRIILLIALFISPSINAITWLSMFDKTVTITHWILLMTPVVLFAGTQISGSQVLKQYPDASPEINHFIKEELKKYNCSEELVNNVNIKLGQRFQAGHILDGMSIITIPEDFKELQDWSAEQKKIIIALSRHEAAHLEHEDMWRMIIISLLSPILAHNFVKSIMYPIKYLLNLSSPSLIGSLLKIPSVFLKMALIIPFILTFAKYKEYSADKKAAQSISDPDILRAVAKIQLGIYEQYEHDHKLNPQERGTWKRFFYDELHTPDRFHPNYLLRAKIFEDAANKRDVI
jgi:hypothetical protein